ncbi:MAG: hypothetical protein DIJKHBIC_00150 [Thermoanaerobaculia bacterium]|nr:hypothetical protein [Thermoanaerobaculia bacterium]
MTSRTVRLALAIPAALLLLPAFQQARAATLTVASVSASCGSQVTVPVTIDSVSGLLAAQFQVAYDPSRLTPGNPAAAAGILTAGFSISSNASGGAITIAMASGTAISGSGTVALLNFTVAANAPPGPILLSISKAFVNDAATGTHEGAVNVSCGASGGPRISIGTVSAKCGDQISVPVVIDGVSGFLAAQFRVAYDPSRLTPASPAAAVGSLTSGFSISSSVSAGAVTVAMASGSPVSGSGTIAVLPFTVAGGASGSIPLDISQVLVNDQPVAATAGAVDLLPCGSDQDLLLSQGRVAATLSWRNQYNGKTGIGTPVKQLDQYGYFWFDSNSNPEVFVKVLDFGGSSFLVFHSALSDLEYTVSFKVLRTGQVYSFRRDAGSVCGLADGQTVKK